jgi:hypothetical protein
VLTPTPPSVSGNLEITQIMRGKRSTRKIPNKLKGRALNDHQRPKKDLADAAKKGPTVGRFGAWNGKTRSQVKN